ncbi:Rap1a/Tai family immunity protein [Sphingomonas canadensis]|uniref:Rap1a/Tai family immunity protein n=1 Tax=Sphingomonas canadensis TaxID=1219257 RepID=A0ABW3HDV6_9SPHN|nr:Rap1a/Tai family immunity protein [Sphingomonas canadensis]MCW3838068.1 Rap1a/Tai family immunity protein [Sphingomonas canadensis]
MIERVAIGSWGARIGAVLLTAAAMAPGAAQAQESTPSTGVFKTAQEVFTICNSTKEVDVEACDWFIMSAHDMMKFYGDTDTGGEKICLPQGTKALEVRTAVLDYWRSKPEARKYSAVSTIYNALTQKYGC